jgi:hypothetical protein
MDILGGKSPVHEAAKHYVQGAKIPIFLYSSHEVQSITLTSCFFEKIKYDFHMLNQMFFGLLLITLTVVIHASAQERIIQFLEWFSPYLGRKLPKLWKISATVIAVMGMLFALITEMWLWALFLLGTNEPSLHNIETALYFSATTFTSLGMGDVVLSPNWRLLGSFEATNGLLLFGWTTAFLFEVISNVYRNDRISN